MSTIENNLHLPPLSQDSSKHNVIRQLIEFFPCQGVKHKAEVRQSNPHSPPENRNPQGNENYNHIQKVNSEDAQSHVAVPSNANLSSSKLQNENAPLENSSRSSSSKKDRKRKHHQEPKPEHNEQRIKQGSEQLFLKAYHRKVVKGSQSNQASALKSQNNVRGPLG